ncbi:hypothetical protein [Scytonema sp. NUACC26]|uniref:hypothetical protein n=1 Tax=Scytonema sp. NUACC26 TaxID=3140176 RepID=UPI0038B256C9
MELNIFHPEFLSRPVGTQYFPPGISVTSGWNLAFSIRNFCRVRLEFSIFHPEFLSRPAGI